MTCLMLPTWVASLAYPRVAFNWTFEIVGLAIAGANLAVENAAALALRTLAAAVDLATLESMLRLNIIFLLSLEARGAFEYAIE